MVTIISLVTIITSHYNIIEYIPCAVLYICVTYLLYNEKFVSLNSSNMFINFLLKYFYKSYFENIVK